jgi:hypothetical protein
VAQVAVAVVLTMEMAAVVVAALVRQFQHLKFESIRLLTMPMSVLFRCHQVDGAQPDDHNNRQHPCHWRWFSQRQLRL